MGEEEDGKLRALEMQLMLSEIREAVSLLKQRMDFVQTELARSQSDFNRRLDEASSDRKNNTSLIWAAGRGLIGLLLVALGYLLQGRI